MELLVVFAALVAVGGVTLLANEATGLLVERMQNGRASE